MKMKKFACLLGATLGVCSLAACGNTNYKTAFSDYWQKSSLTKEAVNEVLEYKVTFEKGAGLDSIGYTLAYGEGSYTTALLSTEDGYAYTTKLTMPVTYTLGEDSTEEMTDTVTTEVKFSRAEKTLKPISSKKTVVSHTPKNGAGSTAQECYSLFEYTVETTYGEGGKSTVAYAKPESMKDTPTVSTFEYGTGKYSYIDNEQLLLAMRAVSLSATSGTLDCYNPFLKKIQGVKYSFTAETSGEFSHTVNGEALPNKNISYREVSLSLDEKNPGGTQTAWIATHTDPAKNANRNVMLYLKTPISYNLGSLVYTLTAVTNQ